MMITREMVKFITRIFGFNKRIFIPSSSLLSITELEENSNAFLISYSSSSSTSLKSIEFIMKNSFELHKSFPPPPYIIIITITLYHHHYHHLIIIIITITLSSSLPSPYIIIVITITLIHSLICIIIIIIPNHHYYHYYLFGFIIIWY